LDSLPLLHANRPTATLGSADTLVRDDGGWKTRPLYWRRKEGLERFERLELLERFERSDPLYGRHLARQTVFSFHLPDLFVLSMSRVRPIGDEGR